LLFHRGGLAATLKADHVVCLGKIYFIMQTLTDFSTSRYTHLPPKQVNFLLIKDFATKT